MTRAQQINFKSSRKNVKMPEYFIIQSRYPGPTVLVTAGIHGTEIAGVMAARMLTKKTIRRGTLIVVPVVNEGAVRKRERGRPDINRAFPRHRADESRHKLAAKVFYFAKTHQPDWCIDLHEADGFYQLDRKKLGQTVVIYPNQTTERIARQVVSVVNWGIEKKRHRFSVKSGVLPGSFRTAAGRSLGAHACTVETCMQMPRQKRIDYQLMIVNTLLRHLGLV